MKRGHALTTLFVLLLSGVVPSHGEETKKIADNLPVLKLDVFPEYRFGQYHADLDVGDVEAGKDYRVQLTVKNPTNNAMVFQGIEESCACYGTKASSLVLDPESEIALEFVGPVEEKMKMPDAFWHVRLKPQDASDMGGIAIKVQYHVSGLMSFLDRRVVLELTENDESLNARIPMLITSPVVPRGVVAVLPKEFGDHAEAKVEEEDGRHFLSLSVAGKDLADQYVAGEISCFDEVTGREDSVYCVIRKSSGVSVFPAILRARDLEGSESTREVTAVVRIDELVGGIDAQNGSEKRRDVLIDATLAGKPIKTAVTQMSRSIYRVKFLLRESALEKLKEMESPAIEWVIRTPIKSHTIRSAISL